MENNYGTPNKYDPRAVYARLCQLSDNDEYTFHQVNGQRIYRRTPESWQGREPTRECEIFIGRIPRDCYEDVLIPLVKQAGDLFEFRLLVQFSGWNRGYGFAMFTTYAAAQRAIEMFNNFMIRPSWFLGVCPTVNNCRLCVVKIPASVTTREIAEVLNSVSEEELEVWFRNTSMGLIAVAEYRSHRGAAIARKMLIAQASSKWGPEVMVDWSTPQWNLDPSQYEEVFHCDPEGEVTQESLGVLSSPNSFTMPSSRRYNNFAVEQLSSQIDCYLKSEQNLHSPAPGSSSPSADITKMVLPGQPRDRALVERERNEMVNLYFRQVTGINQAIDASQAKCTNRAVHPSRATGASRVVGSSRAMEPSQAERYASGLSKPAKLSHTQPFDSTSTSFRRSRSNNEALNSNLNVAYPSRSSSMPTLATVINRSYMANISSISESTRESDAVRGTELRKISAIKRKETPPAGTNSSPTCSSGFEAIFNRYVPDTPTGLSQEVFQFSPSSFGSEVAGPSQNFGIEPSNFSISSDQQDLECPMPMYDYWQPSGMFKHLDKNDDDDENTAL